MSETRGDDSDPLFRQQALEYLSRQRGPGELLKIAVAWLDLVYWAFVLLVIVGVAASLLIRINGEPLLEVLLPALKKLIESPNA